jgi:hypothetical protein
MPVLGGNPQQLLRDIDTSVSFSPDGKQFAFIRGIPDKGVFNLLVANADGSGEKVVTTKSGNITTAGCPVIRAGSNGRCNTIWYKSVFKGGVYEARETVWAFGGAEE